VVHAHIGLDVMYTEPAVSDTLSAPTHGKTTSMSADGKRLVSEAEWQLLQKEVGC